MAVNNPADRDERGDRLEAMLEFMADREVQALELHGDEPGLQARRLCRTCHVSQPCPTQQALRTENTARYISRVADLREKVEELRLIANVNGDWNVKYDQLRRERDELRATVEHITELAFEHNGCSSCQTPWWLRQALGSDRKDTP